MKLRRLLVILLSGLWFYSAQATHNRAGEISYVQTGPLTIEATITTYTKATSTQADQDSLTLCWGDGTCESVLRDNGPILLGLHKGVNIGNNTKINTYRAVHTFPGASRYVLSMTDPNRNAGIINVNPPNSDLIKFHLETSVTLLNPQFQGFNSSPILLQPPIDFACRGNRFVHNPNVFEVEGDSLSYHLIVPLQDVGSDVPNYIFPDDIGSAQPNMLTLDAITGDLVWENPQVLGEYNIAMIIVEYREGVPVDTMIRDMQIFVENCEDNDPPIVDAPEEICVIAGETVSFEVQVDDPNTGDQVQLSAIGGPFIINGSKATLTVAAGYQPTVLTGIFEWTPSCEQILSQPYTVIFKGVDDFRDTTGVATLKTVKIKVIGPPPEDVMIDQSSADSVTISWAKPYDCDVTLDNYFQGFSVWRKIGSSQFPIDTCTPGLDGRGYTKIEFATQDMRAGRYVFVDTDIEKGQIYCYRIVGEFARLTLAGNPYNFVQSLPSEEKCVQIGRDIPLMTNVSILTTDPSIGSIEVRWSNPQPEELDTLVNPGPYRYQLLRAEGKDNPNLIEVPGASFESPNFAGLIDTFYTDLNLNTLEEAYRYQVAFYAGGSTSPFAFSEIATSIYLNVEPTDRANELSWCNEVPWQNSQFEVYRKNSLGVFELIGMTVETTFRDEGLLNGDEYCYIIRSLGTYGIPDIADPLLNWSQEDCAIPFDNVPPCPPEIDVVNNCNTVDPGTPPEDIVNILNWTNPQYICPDADDTKTFKIYFTSTETSDLSMYEEIDEVSDTFYTHVALATGGGCYYVTALDGNGNESNPSLFECVDNCPAYDLPNAFTPNQDGSNDIYVPYPYRYIDRIDMKIYNQWGNLVFATVDPDINWDGRDLNGKELSSGAYYYTCRVFEANLDGVAEQMDILSGYIHLFRTK